MLKNEHAGKIDLFKEKWTKLEQQKNLDKIPEGDEIDEVIGLVEKKVHQKTLHQMILKSHKTKAEKKKEAEQAIELTKKMNAIRKEKEEEEKTDKKAKEEEEK